MQSGQRVELMHETEDVAEELSTKCKTGTHGGQTREG